MNDFINTPQLNKKPSNGYLAFAIVFLCFGCGLIIGLSIYSAIISAKLKYFTITTGTVVGYHVSNSWSNGNHGSGAPQEVYAEIAEFEVDGTIYNKFDRRRNWDRRYGTNCL